MYATVRSYSGTELAAELRQHEAAVKSLISAVAGFRAYYMLETADGSVSITVCDDQAGAEESNRVAAGWIRDNLPNLAIAPPTITAGEVAISI